MPVDFPAFETGKRLGLIRSVAAFGQVALSIDTTRAEALLFRVLRTYDDAQPPLHPRFTTLMVDLGTSGYIARKVTGQDQPPFTQELLMELSTALIRSLNSLTHTPPTGGE